MSRFLGNVLVGALIILLTASAASAQLSTAELSGRVTDTSGAVLPGVTVTMTQTDTQATRTAITDADGRTLAAGSEDCSVELWNLATQREVATLKKHGSVVTSVAFSPDGGLLASGSVDKTVRLWRAPPFTETDRPDGGY